MASFAARGFPRPVSAPCVLSAAPTYTMEERRNSIVSIQSPMVMAASSSSSEDGDTQETASANSSRSITTQETTSDITASTTENDHSRLDTALDQDFAWYRNVEKWDFEKKGVGTGKFSTNQNLLTVDTEVNAETTAEEEEPKRIAGFNWKKYQLIKTTLSRLRQDAGLSPQIIETNTAWAWDDPLSCPPNLVAFITAELRGLRQIVAQNQKQGATIPKPHREKLVNRIQQAVLVIDRIWDSPEAPPELVDFLRELKHESYKLVYEYEDLVDPLRPCIVCGGRDRSRNYIVKVTNRCNHKTNTCSPCLQQWIASQIADKGWDKIQCAECPEILQHADIQAAATEEVFQRYDELSTRAALNAIAKFRWCLNPACSAGQIHRSGMRFKCHACQHQYCIKHSTAWHQNETCEEYDTRRQSARIHNEASEEWKSMSTRICPECNVAIEKNGGCDHMGCTRCFFQFSWDEAMLYTAQEIVPLEDTRASLAAPSLSLDGRGFRIWRAIKLIFWGRRRGRETIDIC